MKIGVGGLLAWKGLSLVLPYNNVQLDKKKKHISTTEKHKKKPKTKFKANECKENTKFLLIFVFKSELYDFVFDDCI